jgi:hypothetical protein
LPTLVNRRTDEHQQNWIYTIWIFILGCCVDWLLVFSFSDCQTQQ